MVPQSYKRKTCRICDSSNLTKVFDLGKMPLANAFRAKKDFNKPELKFPLSLHFCNNCSLAQLINIVNPKLLFKKYNYLTSSSKPLLSHFADLAEEISQNYIKNKNELLVEIGSNDGILLEALKNKNRILGVDPAKNIEPFSAERGVETICDFFSYPLAGKILKKHGPAKVIVANNVVAHIDNVGDFLRGVRKLLSPNGVFVFEIHWVGNLISNGGFDQIYHEHVSYFSLNTIQRLCKQEGFVLADVKLLPVQGQSMRCYAFKEAEPTPEIAKLLLEEKKMGLHKLNSFINFGQKVEANREHLGEMLRRLKKENKKIIGYGAPAKGNTLLNYFRIGPEFLDFITDTTPLKQGLFTPGTSIKIVSPDKIADYKPDYILLLSWNYAEQILKKEKLLRDSGVKFIIPVPNLKII